MVVAMSSFGVFALCVPGFVLLVLVGSAVSNFGRAAEQISESGHKITRDRPEFSKPPDEGRLL